jgi:hypothetical protein
MRYSSSLPYLLSDQTGTTMGLGDFALFVERIMSSRAADLIIAQIELRSDLLQV